MDCPLSHGWLILDQEVNLCRKNLFWSRLRMSKQLLLIDGVRLISRHAQAFQNACLRVSGTRNSRLRRKSGKLIGSKTCKVVPF